MSDILKIITEWKEHPCLYNPADKFYKNRKKQKEAYKKITAAINKRATKQYKVEEIIQKMKNLRAKYRLIRKHRMYKYEMERLSPQPPKWWIMLHSILWDEKITKHPAEDGPEKQVKRAIKRYLNKESSHTEGLKFDDGSQRNEKDIMDKLISVEIEDDSERDFFIKCLEEEPCLYKTTHEHYNNKKHQEAAYKRITKMMNKEFLDGYTVDNVKLYMEVLIEYYLEIREIRFKRFVSGSSLCVGRRRWWAELNILLADENPIEETAYDKIFTKDEKDDWIKSYFEREHKIYIDDEDDTEFEYSSEIDSYDDCEEESEEESEDDSEEDYD